MDGSWYLSTAMWNEYLVPGIMGCSSLLRSLAQGRLPRVSQSFPKRGRRRNIRPEIRGSQGCLYSRQGRGSVAWADSRSRLASSGQALDSAESFASERSCSARDDRVEKGNRKRDAAWLKAGLHAAFNTGGDTRGVRGPFAIRLKGRLFVGSLSLRERLRCLKDDNPADRSVRPTLACRASLGLNSRGRLSPREHSQPLRRCSGRAWPAVPRWVSPLTRLNTWVVCTSATYYHHGLG